ncbi:MAG: glycine--tRNA ligase subunit beta, partial [Candidatus Omnitrophica bacterium]|nr:glycine--tRNA ligase subunit beta [Candidatus Omnitrophota bacterium]
IPQTALGGICSLADKFDNIVSYFKIGKFPKGSWDLYALRRQAIGIISILIKMDVALSLSQVFDHIYMASPGASDKKKLKEMLLDFFKERFISFVKERFSYRYDLIDAVVTGGIIDNVQSCFLKLESLNSIIDEPYFENARCVVERTYNIVKSSKSAAGDIKASLLKEPQEHRLHDKLKEVREDFKQLCAEKRYGEATKLYAETFSDETHEFFDKVMVNVNDRSLKNNRIALLEAINKLYVEQIADLSKVVVQT